MLNCCLRSGLEIEMWGRFVRIRDADRALRQVRDVLPGKSLACFDACVCVSVCALYVVSSHGLRSLVWSSCLGVPGVPAELHQSHPDAGAQLALQVACPVICACCSFVYSLAS